MSMSISDLTGSQTYRATRGRVPVFRPQMNGEDFPVTVQEAGFILSEGSHDAASLKCTSTELTTTDGLLDSTIAFYYGQAPRTELFTGYITSIEESKVGQGNISFTIDILGATQPMQVGRPRLWARITAPSAVQNLAYANGLGFYGSDDSFLWPSIGQSSESDWTMANNITGRLGWSLFSRYGVIMPLNPLDLHANQGAYATLMSSQDQEFDPTAARRLIEFSPKEVSESVPLSYGSQIAYFTDTNEVQVTQEIGTFKAYKFVTGFYVGGVEEANVYANAPKSKISEWKQFAQARIWGDCDIYPGMCVDVITTNTRFVRQKFDGRWLVRGVTHQMDTKQFQTMLVLARPSNTVQVTQDPYQSFWQRAGKSRPTLSIQNKVWMSSWTNPQAVAV